LTILIFQTKIIVVSVEAIGEGRRAALLMHPLRLRVLEAARAPISAADIGRVLRLPRQRVNYHVRALARAGFLRRAGQRRKRNLVEKRYVATAEAYVLMPELLGALAPDPAAAGDAVSAARLLGLMAAAQAAVARAQSEASARGQRLSTLSLDAEFRFESAEQRAAFAEALRGAVTDVVGRLTSPGVGVGKRYRLIVGCYPVGTANGG
jgi:hypothetical protein